MEDKRETVADVIAPLGVIICLVAAFFTVFFSGWVTNIGAGIGLMLIICWIYTRLMATMYWGLITVLDKTGLLSKDDYM